MFTRKLEDYNYWKELVELKIRAFDSLEGRLKMENIKNKMNKGKYRP